MKGEPIDTVGTMMRVHREAWHAHHAMAQYHDAKYAALVHFERGTESPEHWAWYYLLMAEQLKEEADALTDKAIRNIKRDIARAAAQMLERD